MQRPKPSPLATHWGHDPSVIYLNHGSFGGTPLAVLEAQRAIQSRMESEPVRFFVDELWPLMDEVRHALAEFLHCQWDCIAPVPNATTGVATIFTSLVDSGYLNAGTEILTTSHEYTACQNNLIRAAKRSGATVCTVDLPFPVRAAGGDDGGEIEAAIMSQVNSRTKLALLSHVTSASGLVLPMDRIVRSLEAKGVRTLIDGAHAPGMVADLDLARMNPSYYTANCHKWLCTPKGSAFLYVKPELRDEILPVVLSNNAQKPRPGRDQFLTGFDYVGTNDFSAFLSIPAGLRFMAGLVDGGWPRIMERNRGMCIQARDLICRHVGMTPPAPNSMIGCISTMILPPHSPQVHARVMARPTRQHDAMWDALNAKYGIQVPVWGLANRSDRFIRIACQLFNSMEQYEYLAHALKMELEFERQL